MALSTIGAAVAQAARSSAATTPAGAAPALCLQAISSSISGLSHRAACPPLHGDGSTSAADTKILCPPLPPASVSQWPHAVNITDASAASACSARACTHQQASTSGAAAASAQLHQWNSVSRGGGRLHQHHRLARCTAAWPSGNPSASLSTSSRRSMATLFMTEDSPSAAVEGAVRAEQATAEVRAQLSRCVTVDQLDAVLDPHLHVLDGRCLMEALNVLVRSISAARSAPLMPTVCRKLGAAYMQLLPDLTQEEALSLLHTFAVLRVNPGGDEEGYKALCGHLSEVLLPELQQREQYTELGNLVWALHALSQHGELEFDHQILTQSAHTLQAYMHSMPLSVLSKVTEAYAECGESFHTFLEKVPMVLLERMRMDLDVVAITNILKSLANAKAPVPATLLHQVADVLVHRPVALKLHHVTSLAKSFAVLRYGEDDPDQAYDTDRFWAAVSSYVERNRVQLTPQMVQDLAYAFALRKQPDDGLYNLLSLRSKALLDTFKPANVSMMLLGFARQGRQQDTGLYAAACKHIVAHLDQYSWQNMANSLWALACVDHKDEALLVALAAHIKQLLKDPDGRAGLQVDPEAGRERFFIPGQCPRVERWAEPDGSVKQAIEYKSGNKVVRPLNVGIPARQFISQNLTDLMWAFAKLQHKDPELFALFCQRCLENVDSFSLTSVVDTYWALTAAEMSHPELLQALARYLLETTLVSRLGLDYLADVLYAHAVLGCPVGPEFLKAALDVAQGKWDRLKAHQDATLVRLLWSFQELGVLDSFPKHPFVARIHDFLALAEADAQVAGEQKLPDQQ